MREKLDPQQEGVYDAEREWRTHFPSRRLTLPGLERAANHVLGSEWSQNLFGLGMASMPTVTVLPSTNPGTARAYFYSIELPEQGLTVPVLLHELSHVVHFQVGGLDLPAHDPEWVEIMLVTVAEWMSHAHADLLRACYSVRGVASR